MVASVLSKTPGAWPLGLLACRPMSINPTLGPPFSISASEPSVALLAPVENEAYSGPKSLTDSLLVGHCARLSKIAVGTACAQLGAMVRTAAKVKFCKCLIMSIPLYILIPLLLKTTWLKDFLPYVFAKRVEPSQK